LLGRADTAVIGSALLAKAAGQGHRTIAAGPRSSAVSAVEDGGEQ
jgi:hypothetical protein